MLGGFQFRAEAYAYKTPYLWASRLAGLMKAKETDSYGVRNSGTEV